LLSDQMINLKVMRLMLNKSLSSFFYPTLER
jgi:hypothetical protein